MNASDCLTLTITFTVRLQQLAIAVQTMQLLHNAVKEIVVKV
jgi:hypothetical protein